MTPKLYNADPNTGKYLEGMETQVRENPKYAPDTHTEADRYLYSRRTSTLEPPMTTGENENAFLVNGEWVKMTDRMGQHYYEPDGTRVDITEPGVDIPAGCIQEDPPGKYYNTHDGAAWVLDLAAARSDMKVAIHREKKRVRDSGVTVDNLRFDTDITARISYQEFAAKIAADPAYTVPDWKASGDVFVAMDAALYERISTAMEQLMSRVFNWQKDQNARVDAVSDPATAMEELEQISTTYTG